VSSKGGSYSGFSCVSNVTVFIFDKDGSIALAEGCTESFGYPDRNSLSGKSIEEVFPSAVSSAFRNAFNSRKSGETTDFSFTLGAGAANRQFEVKCSPLLLNSVFDGTLTVVHEITEQKESNNALAQSEKNYRTLVEMATMGIVIVTDEKLVFTNPFTSEISGFSPEELAGSDFTTLIAPAERERIRRTYVNRLKGKSMPEIYETQSVRKDGSIIDVEISARQIEYRGKPSIQVIVKDISLNKRAERELLTIQETLQKMVLERTAELESYREHLLDVVDERTTRLRNTVNLLRIEIKERTVVEERAEHLKQMLKAIRSINLLITKETDVQVLVDAVCTNLVEARDYKDVWISLKNKDGSYMAASATRNSKHLESFRDHLIQGVQPPCIQKSLAIDEPWLSEASASVCSGCPLKPDSAEPGHIMACRLRYRDRVFGVLTVASLGPAIPDSEELGLFAEVCNDIAFALDSIEREKEKELATKALNESENRYKALFENSGMAILFTHEDMILDCNAKAAEVFRCSRKDLTGMRPYDLSPRMQPDGQFSVEKGAEKIQAAINNEPQHFSWIHTRVDGEEFPAEISLNAVKIGGKNYIQAIVNDVSLRMEAENALKQSENNLRTLSST
jgi:PAS domain S-box-containing protein